MLQPIIRNVSLAPCCRETVGTGRCGTAAVSVEAFARRFGNPHTLRQVGKVKAEWFVDTPRGPVAIHDYWWNAPGELSLGGRYRACLWAAAWLRHHGVKATARRWYQMAEGLRAA